MSRAARHAAATSSAGAPSSASAAASSSSPNHPMVSAAAPLLAQGDFGLLHAIDDRLAAYGWETNTGVRFVAVVDMRGRVLDRSLPSGARSSSVSPAAGGRAGGASPARDIGGSTSAVAAALHTKVVGLRDGELKVVFRAMQTAYVRLLQNPFYDPDETVAAPAGRRITSRRFTDEMRRIGEVWVPGSVNAL
jgi:trafficking protein particle complex subunit 2